MGWNHWFIPKLQRLCCWKFGNRSVIYPTFYNGCNYSSMSGFKLIHVSKGAQGQVSQRNKNICVDLDLHNDTKPTKGISGQINTKTRLYWIPIYCNNSNKWMTHVRGWSQLLNWSQDWIQFHLQIRWWMELMLRTVGELELELKLPELELKLALLQGFPLYIIVVIITRNKYISI